MTATDTPMVRYTRTIFPSYAFYVSDCKDEWDSDRYDLSHGFALAYVWNRTDEICSEFGSISFEPKFGGVVRQG